MNDDNGYLKVVDQKEVDARRLETRGHYGHEKSVVLHKSVDDIAIEVDLPSDHLRHLQKICVISQPLTQKDVDFLHLHRIFIEHEKNTVKTKSRKRRPLVTPKLNVPWMIYVYLRYLRNKIIYNTDGSMVNPGDRIFIKSLRREVAYRFGVANTSELHAEIKGIRSTANNDKRKEANGQNLSLEEIARQRGVTEDIDFNTSHHVTRFTEEIQFELL